MKKIVTTSIALFVLAGIISAIWFITHPEKKNRTLSTYFTYTETELAPIKNLSSEQAIKLEDLYQFDEIAFDLVAKNTKKKEFSEETSKIYAYLTVAERDFAFLSYNKNGEFNGSIGPVSKAVLCNFFPTDCNGINIRNTDPYSQVLTDIVMTKVKERIQEDTANLKPFPLKDGEAYWSGPQPSIGITNPSSKGWFIKSGDEFRVSPPLAIDSEEFKEELRLTKEALVKATPEQKRATVFWAGGPGTKTPPGQLITLSDDYMQGKNISRIGDQYIEGKTSSLEKSLLVRSVVAMAIADAVTTVFDSKYFYQVKRPFMMDSSIATIMPTPNHPSYPSGHSTLSTAAATVLAHYFPEDKDFWEETSTEAGLSRVWGGIHFMMDHEAGVTLGKQVGEAAITGTHWQEK